MKTITYQRDGGILSPVLPYDCPMWELGNTHDSLAIVEAEEFTFPDQIIIIGTLKPFWVESSATGHFRNNSGDQFSPTPFYNSMSALRRIEWHAEWIEKDKGACEAISEPFVWGVNFGVQDQPIVSDYALPTHERSGIWQQTGSSLEPIWSWGGYYQPGCALDAIKPMYVRLCPDGSQTCLQWISVINPLYHVLCGAAGDFEKEGGSTLSSMTLMNHFQFGSIHYFPPNLNDSIGYQSTRVLDYDPTHARVKLLFLRRHHGTYSANH
jgi:hypothetical protein